MKKVIILIVFLLISHMSYGINDWFNFRENKNSSICITTGAHYSNYMNKELDVPSLFPPLGIGGTFYGIYLDGMFSFPHYVYDKKEGDVYYSSAYLFHIGYNIPIHKYFSMIPIYGLYRSSQGYSDTNYCNFMDNIPHNCYQESNAILKHDYGVKFVSHIPCKSFYMDINYGITNNMFLFGLGISMKIK